MKKFACLIAALGLISCSFTACDSDDDSSLAKLNEPCAVAEDCESGACAASADDASKLVCVEKSTEVELLADGAECDKDEACKSGSCKAESEDEGAKMVCVAKAAELLADGAECDKDEACQSGSCKAESEDEGAKMICVAKAEESEPQDDPKE